MKIQSFHYQEARVLSARLLLTRINNDPERENFFVHEFRGVPHHLRNDTNSIKDFLSTKIVDIVQKQFPDYESFKFNLDLTDLYYERAGRASIFLNHKTYKFIINEDGQWQVSCKKLTSDTNSDYSLMFNKLDELTKAIRGN